MGAALGWGALAASSLVVGSLLALVHSWPRRLVGHVLAFGAGALISAVSFELAEEGARAGGLRPVAAGLAVGALVYFLLDGALEARSGRGTTADAGGAGVALALGAFLDGVPEQAVLGIGLAGGGAVSVGLFVAIFVSNLPEAIGSANAMIGAGTPRRQVLVRWLAVAAVCAAATVAGFAVADSASGGFKAGVNGFAAGALLVMLVDSMIPDAARASGRTAGLTTTFGFAVATALSAVE